jgi:hypothetical protein
VKKGWNKSATTGVVNIMNEFILTSIGGKFQQGAFPFSREVQRIDEINE